MLTVVFWLMVDCDLSVAMEACKPVPQDKYCDLQLNDTDPGDTMMTALRDAMEWPSWNTLWTKRYPALENITWFPGSTVNNTISYNSKLALHLPTRRPSQARHVVHTKSSLARKPMLK